MQTEYVVQTCSGAFSEHYFCKARKLIYMGIEREEWGERQGEAFLRTVEFQLIKVMKQLLRERIHTESMTDTPFPAAQHKKASSFSNIEGSCPYPREQVAAQPQKLH